MAKTKLQWLPIEEMDLEDGTHTAYWTSDPKSKDYWYTITQLADGTWDVELSTKRYSGAYTTMVNCKTLTSAKRWAARYL